MFYFLKNTKNSPEQTTCSGSHPPCCPQGATNSDLPELEISHLQKNKKQKKKKKKKLRKENGSSTSNPTVARQTAHQRQGCCPEARGGPP